MVVTVAALPVIEPAIGELNVCAPVNVCAASVLAIVALVDGNVIVVASVPASVRLLLDVSVFPSAMVRVDPFAGAVIVTLLTLVAVATPIVGVTKVGLVSITNLLPVPVCDATEVAFPELVMGPVKFALVAFAVVIAPVTNSVVAIWVELFPAVAVGANGVPVKLGEAKGAAPVTSATGILALAVMAEVPDPLI